MEGNSDWNGVINRPVAWKDKQTASILTHMHLPSAESHFCDWYGKALKPATVHSYNRHMGYVDNDPMTNSYATSKCTWKWTEKIILSECPQCHCGEIQ
jgi:hypothetical protein